MATTVVISVILVLVGIVVTVLIHVIAGRTFRRGFSSASMEETGNNGGNSVSIDDLEKLPCFEFKLGDKESSTIDCAVCLESLKMGDNCRLLPICKHRFHAQCIDSWLLKTPNCPICRTSTDSRNHSVVLIEETSNSSDEVM
ncbi:hypothetical protein NE237_007903 [Protea cynaroides]|uniref:RING-type domain-containing protein n=1 Tax=Protea cynaroides TaxID=273540 RepID=A0A9Q0QWX7_9MAGN|nr:hypothetical protein NE237_007903 [Protea cynaroides]